MPDQPAPAGIARVVVTLGEEPVLDVAGLADAVTGAPLTRDTSMHLCSMSKWVTAVGVLRLAARGVLDLDAEVLVDSSGQRPTVRQLLGHRGGVVDPPGSFEPSDGPVPSTRDVVAGTTSAHAGPVRVMGEPGTAFSYSDAGYCLVERAVEVATGEPFADVLHREVVVPLGLRRTAFWSGGVATGPRGKVTAVLERTAAAGHHGDGQRVAARRAHYPGLAASGLWASPADLAVLLTDVARAFDGDERAVLLTGEQAAALRADPGGLGVGLGVFVARPPRRVVMTQGWGVGFQGQAQWFPDARAAAAVVVDTDPGVPQEESVVGRTLSGLAAGRGWD